MTEAVTYFKSMKADGSDWRKNSVSCQRMAHLLFHLIETKEQGIILFMDKRRKMNVNVKGGMITEVQSNYIREDTLGRFLIQQKIITPEQNQTSLEKARKMKLPQGQILVTMRVLKQRELISYVTQHKMRKFLRVFQGLWDGVEYEYIPQSVEGKKASMEPISLKRMLKLGILKISQMGVLYETFLQNKWLNRPFVLTADFDKNCQLLRVNQEIFKVAQWLDNQSLLDVERSHPDRFSLALRTAFFMLIIQGARLGEEQQQKPEEPEEADITSLHQLPVESESGNPLLQQAIADANNFFESEDYRIAKVFLEKAVQIDPGSSVALAMLAWAQFQLAGKKKDLVLSSCKDMIKQAIRIDPNNDMAHLYLGKIYKHESRFDLAGPHFRRANIINPNNEDAQNEVRLLEEHKRKSIESLDGRQR